ncbi:MFS transporter [Vallitalea guaymasensis]|uniref:MFS transporter n=1 Tax=Vallitalea guaymasensis TaxID=1185412 RepID=A0A8J8MC04_9FIRM|nr:MFS transporter [Vallitalea guaymasensis]QUH30117.1 MFS transporter [Vallitalea guaymasensis]
MNKTKKNTILFLLGKLVSLFGTRIYGFAMGLYILKITGSALNFSISILLSTIPALIFGPIGGVIADRVDRKKMVLLADFFSGVIMFIAFGLSQIFGLELWIIYMSTVLLSILNALFATAFDAALPNLVDESSLSKVNSYNQAMNSLTGVLAPIIGGIVYALVPPTMFILFNGISFVLSTFSEYFIDFYWKVEKSVEKIVIKEVDFFANIKEGFAYIKTKSLIFSVISVAVFINFLFTAINVAIPHIVVVQFNMSDEIYGIIESALAIGSLFVSITFANKLGVLKPLKMGLFVIGLGIINILFSVPLIATGLLDINNFVAVYYSILFFLMGCILVLINIPMAVYIQKTTDDEYRGRVMGLNGTLCMAISPLGYLLHGFLLDLIPTYIIMIYAGVGIFLIAIYMIKKMNKIIENDESIVGVKDTLKVAEAES